MRYIHGSVAEASASWSPSVVVEFCRVRSVHKKKQRSELYILSVKWHFLKHQFSISVFDFLELPLEEAQTATSVQNLKRFFVCKFSNLVFALVPFFFSLSLNDHKGFFFCLS